MIIVSAGLGTNSTAMLIGMHERDIYPDAILFADTGGERPHTYEHLRILNNWLGKVGFPLITVVKAANKTLEEALLSNKSLPSPAYGGRKTCSQRFKIEPQDTWLNNWPPAKKIWNKGQKITKAVGFDADEPWRAKDYESKKFSNWYPLLEWDWGRDECIETINRAGLPLPGKSSCFYCPNMKQAEIRELKAHYPELALRAIEMEQNANLTTIKGLGRDWSWEQLLEIGELFEFPDRQDQTPCECYEGAAA